MTLPLACAATRNNARDRLNIRRFSPYRLLIDSQQPYSFIPDVYCGIDVSI